MGLEGDRCEVDKCGGSRTADVGVWGCGVINMEEITRVRSVTVCVLYECEACKCGGKTREEKMAVAGVGGIDVWE